MKKLTHHSLSAPLISMFILMNGFALLSTYIPIQMKVLQANSFEIGLISSLYYTGMVFGSFWNATFILRVGHIRAFAAFASIATCMVLLCSINYSILYWLILRCILGYCLSGLYIVVESWILNESSTKNRGMFLSLYMISLYGASATGQLMLSFSEIGTFLPFIIVSFLTSLSILPLAITRTGNPTLGEPSALNIQELFKIAPSGTASCFWAGGIFSATISFMPLYLQETLNSISELGYGMFVMILGGVMLQYPIGKLSDYTDRRKVLFALCAILCLISVVIIVFPKPWGILFIELFLFGGVTHTLYPVSISHACDNLPQEKIVSATQGLMLSYGLGAVIGPLVSSTLTLLLGSVGLFVFLFLMGVSLSVYLYYRLINHSSNDASGSSFIPVPSTTPIALEIDPRVTDEISDQ